MWLGRRVPATLFCSTDAIVRCVLELAALAWHDSSQGHSPWVIGSQANPVASGCDLLQVIGFDLPMLSDLYLILLAGAAICDGQGSSSSTRLGPRGLCLRELPAENCTSHRALREESLGQQPSCFDLILAQRAS